jgi:hypothetical protein
MVCDYVKRTPATLNGKPISWRMDGEPGWRSLGRRFAVCCIVGKL